MPAPLARGIIITVTVLVAASIAAYENPQIRAWIDRTRHKIAMGLHSLGDDINPRPRLRRTSTDISMHEEKGELAEERRRRAIAEIMERGRVMQERRKRRRLSDQEKPRSPTFDTLVDQNGILLDQSNPDNSIPAAQSTAVDNLAKSTNLRQRNGTSAADNTVSDEQTSNTPPLPARRLSQSIIHQPDQSDFFESRYEREMRESWNIPLSERRIEIPSSHASESLIDLTPMTEGAPDPDFSVPSAEYLSRQLERSEYFPAATSNSTHTISDHESETGHTSQRGLPQEDLAQTLGFHRSSTPTASSIADSVSNINFSEAEESADEVLSEIGDGVRTPASAWTDVDSTVSSDFNL